MIFQFRTFCKSFKHTDQDSIPLIVHIVPEDYVLLRHAKTRTRFREHLLRKVHDCQKVLGNLLLFKCVVCKNRLVAFHPDHQPSEELAITRTYPNAVAEWETEPDATRSITSALIRAGSDACCLHELVITATAIPTNPPGSAATLIPTKLR